VDDNCYCIDGGCDYYFSSSSYYPMESSSSSSKPASSSSSSEYVYNGTLCRISDNLYAPLSTLPNVHQQLYSSLPHMTNTDKISVSACSCNEDGSFKCTYENFGLGQGYTPSYVSLCGFKEAYWCSGISKGVCDYTGSSKEVYYSDRYNATGYTWGVMSFSGTEVMDMETGNQPVYVKSSIGTLLFFTMRHVLPANVTTYDLENAFLKANPRFPSLDRMNDYCRGEWVPHDDDCFGTEQESVEAAEDSSSDCALAAGVAHYSHGFTEEHGWCVAGKCEGGDFYSSAAESSSSGGSSSSSGGALCEAHPFTSVPENPLSACFEVSGKCYKCNDDRGSECANDWLWIYDFNSSNVGWWYTEVDCETGSEKTTEDGIGVCPSHPLSKVPSDPQDACFASNGKCYKCNDDRGSECGNDWLWIYDFNSSNVGWWYTEVDCYNPNGDDGQCPDGSILQKSVAKANGNSQIESEDYSIDFLPSRKYFDVLGRKANHSSKQKRALYSLDRTNNQNSALTEDTEFSERILRLLNEHSSYNNVLRKSKSCGVLGGDYGIVEKDGSLTGGMTCPIVNTYYTLKYVEGPQKVGSCGANGDSAIVDVLVEDSLQSYLASDEHYVVPVNYIFPGTNYMVTEEDSIKLERHELGHVAYNECIEAKFPNEIEVVSKRFCECESTLQKSYEEWIEPLRQKKYVQDTTRFVRASDLFHEKYTSFDGADSYVCPSGL